MMKKIIIIIIIIQFLNISKLTQRAQRNIKSASNIKIKTNTHTQI